MKKKLLLIISMLLFIIIWLYLFNNKNNTLQIKEVIKEENQNIINWEIKKKSNLLNDINKKTLEEIEKEKKEKIEIEKLLNEYNTNINNDNDISSFLSKESIDVIQLKTITLFNKLSFNDKEKFIKDLNDLWLKVDKNFNPSNHEYFLKYLNFLIKYPIKLKWKITSINLKDFQKEKGYYLLNYDIIFENKDVVPIIWLKIKDNKIKIDNY